MSEEEDGHWNETRMFSFCLREEAATSIASYITGGRKERQMTEIRFSE
jgi:hypothetical protein